MPDLQSHSRVGIYVDASNMYFNGGRRLQYDVLREFACRDGAEVVRLNAYVSYDYERGDRDDGYREGTNNFYSALRDMGYKVIVKPVRWYEDERGERYGKANADLDLAVDALLQSENIDRILIASGDGDFAKVIRALQNKGCRIEVVALNNASSLLRQEADLFISGFLIPNLVPIESGYNRSNWGDVQSRVRGWCHWYNSEKGFGYIRYMKTIAPGLWLTDARLPDSPYEAAFFHISEIEHISSVDRLPSRRYIFEFDLLKGEKGYQAKRIDLISVLPSPENRADFT